MHEAVPSRLRRSQLWPQEGLQPKPLFRRRQRPRNGRFFVADTYSLPRVLLRRMLRLGNQRTGATVRVRKRTVRYGCEDSLDRFKHDASALRVTLVLRIMLLLFSAVAPAASILLALPLVLGSGPDLGHATSWFKDLYWLITASVALGICSAPGYVCAVLGQDRWLSLRSVQLWLVPSLVVASVVSLLGAVLATLAFWQVAVLPVISFLTCLCLIISVLLKLRTRRIAQLH